MRFQHWLAPALTTLLAAVALSGSVRADELQMTSAPQASSERPARGMSMDKVEATFGAPAHRVPSVGQPPISRWEYPGFVVYFENNLVIHAVAIG
jgi:hypothetical protein